MLLSLTLLESLAKAHRIPHDVICMTLAGDARMKTVRENPGSCEHHDSHLCLKNRLLLWLRF